MKAHANGIAVHYTIEGQGPWLVMSHALACNHRMWDAQAARLAQRYTVLRYDTRGHGASDAPSGPYSFDMLAADAVALFDVLGIEQAHWLGLSMGGMIGQALVLAQPQLVSSLVLADTSSRYPAEVEKIWADRIRTVRSEGMEAVVDATLERWFTEPYRHAHPEVMQRIGDMIRATPVEGYAGCGQPLRSSISPGGCATCVAPYWSLSVSRIVAPRSTWRAKFMRLSSNRSSWSSRPPRIFPISSRPNCSIKRWMTSIAFSTKAQSRSALSENCACDPVI